LLGVEGGYLDNRISLSPFTAAFANPADSENPLIFNGTSEPAGNWLLLPLLTSLYVTLMTRKNQTKRWLIKKAARISGLPLGFII